MDIKLLLIKLCASGVQLPERSEGFTKKDNMLKKRKPIAPASIGRSTKYGMIMRLLRFVGQIWYAVIKKIKSKCKD